MGWREAVGGFLVRVLGAPAEGRASLENPSTPLSNPDEWLYEALGARKSASGVRVNRETALTYAAVWRGTNLISRDVGKLPLVIYKRQGEGKARAPEHAAYNLLRRKPNQYMTAFVFRQTLQAHVLLRGNGYAYIFRRGDGTPLELLPLNPDSTYPVRENGVLMYITEISLTVQGQTGGAPVVQLRKLPAADVLHIKGLSFDGLIGYDVITKARESLGLGIAMEEFGSRFFRNNAKPSVVIEHPGKLTDQAAKKLREQWNSIHSGLENAHKTAVLEEGMKLKEFSIAARNAQLIESRQFQIREVANWFGVPPHKLGDTTRTAFASLEQENQSYLDDALDPWLVNWEEECWDKLLTEEEKAGDTHVIEFMRHALVRANLADRGIFYSAALSAGWISRDEVRARENLNPIPDGQGQVFLFPLNMAPNGITPAPAKKPAKKPDSTVATAGEVEDTDPEEPAD